MQLHGLYVGTMTSYTKIGEDEGRHLTFTFALLVCWVYFSNQPPEWHLKTNKFLLDLSCFITTVISTTIYQQRNINKWEKNVPLRIYCKFLRRLFTLHTSLLLLDWSVGTVMRYLKRASNRNEYQEYFLGGKGVRYVGLTTLPLSCADCLEIWEPRPTGTLRACPGL
jgi:hypothetical protein